VTATADTERLIRFAADVHQLANERPDLELCELIDDLHFDLVPIGDDDDDD
jgi:hypothetical protein